jgi:hypothetical protein
MACRASVRGTFVEEPAFSRSSNLRRRLSLLHIGPQRRRRLTHDCVGRFTLQSVGLRGVPPVRWILSSATGHHPQSRWPPRCEMQLIGACEAAPSPTLSGADRVSVVSSDSANAWATYSTDASLSASHTLAPNGVIPTRTPWRSPRRARTAPPPRTSSIRRRRSPAPRPVPT